MTHWRHQAELAGRTSRSNTFLVCLIPSPVHCLFARNASTLKRSTCQPTRASSFTSATAVRLCYARKMAIAAYSALTVRYPVHRVTPGRPTAASLNHPYSDVKSATQQVSAFASAAISGPDPSRGPDAVEWPLRQSRRRAVKNRYH